MRNLAANAPEVGMGRLQRMRDLMKAALPTADVRGYEPLISDIVLPDPDDCHVVAAAITGGASLIVTWNTADVPETDLARHGLRRKTPDQFALRLHEVAPAAVLAAIVNARLNLRTSRPTAAEFASVLVRQGLRGFADVIGNGSDEARTDDDTLPGGAFYLYVRRPRLLSMLATPERSCNLVDCLGTRRRCGGAIEGPRRRKRGVQPQKGRNA